MDVHGRVRIDRSRHGEHLVQLTRLRFSNCYLVAEDDGLTLLDTSIRGSAAAIVSAARAIGAPIRRILITHPHVDHVGSLDALVSILPGVEVMISELDAGLMAGDFSSFPGGVRGALLRSSYARPAVRPTATIAAGERIGSLTAIAAPGHTPGQLAFIDERDRSLICGDAYYALGRVFVTSEVVPWFPFAALGTWSRPTAKATALELRRLNPTRLAAGHGPVVGRPLAAMDRALRAVGVAADALAG